MHSSSSGDLISKESRTPGAWRTREHNLIHQPILQQQQPLSRSPPSPNSITTTTTATTDETSSEIETSESSRRRYNKGLPPSYGRSNTLRSTRSVPALNEDPSWSGEPCPVHGNYAPHHHHHHHPIYSPPPPPPPSMQPPPAIIINGHNPYGTCHYPPTRLYPGNYSTMKKAGSLFDIRLANSYAVSTSPRMHFMPPPNIPLSQLSTPTPLIGQGLEKKSMYGSEHSFHALMQASAIPMGGTATPMPSPFALPPMPPPHLLPPGMRPRPLVIPAGVEPLPVRDPGKSKNGLSGKNPFQYNGRMMGSKTNLHLEGKPKSGFHCCKGPLPLIWFIIGIVTMGVVLGVVLGSIYS